MRTQGYLFTRRSMHGLLEAAGPAAVLAAQDGSSGALLPLSTRKAEACVGDLIELVLAVAGGGTGLSAACQLPFADDMEAMCRLAADGGAADAAD